MTASPYLDHTFASSEGVHALLMPMQSRRIDLRVFHVPRSPTMLSPTGDLVKTPVSELAPAQWLPCPEGEFSGDPFSTGSAREPGLGPMAIIQAFVNLGHSLGMTPKGAEDRSAEVAALRYHLEDMRKLAGVRSENQPLKG